YTFPPLHSFPPFFTPQSHAETWSTQATNWSSIIRSWCKHHRRFFLDAKGEWERGGADGLFESRICARRLDELAIERILAFMVERGELPSKPKIGAALSTRALIFWYRPEEWADQIYAWICSTGQNGSILTLYELTHGDPSEGTEFHELPDEMLRKALAILIKDGKAALLEATGGEGDGVKFL
ncbi:ESCRT-II complex, vps25 subunit, partial [Ceraceosorus guamensis]